MKVRRSAMACPHKVFKLIQLTVHRILMDEYQIKLALNCQDRGRVYRAKQQVKKLQLQRKSQQQQPPLNKRFIKKDSFSLLPMKSFSEQHKMSISSVQQTRKKFLRMKAKIRELVQENPSTMKEIREHLKVAQLLSEILRHQETKDFVFVNDISSFRREELFFKEINKPRLLARLDCEIEELMDKINQIHMKKKSMDTDKHVQALLGKARDFTALMIDMQQHYQKVNQSYIQKKPLNHKAAFLSKRNLLGSQSQGLTGLKRVVDLYGQLETRVNYKRFERMEACYEQLEEFKGLKRRVMSNLVG